MPSLTQHDTTIDNNRWTKPIKLQPQVCTYPSYQTDRTAPSDHRLNQTRISSPLLSKRLQTLATITNPRWPYCPTSAAGWSQEAGWWTGRDSAGPSQDERPPAQRTGSDRWHAQCHAASPRGSPRTAGRPVGGERTLGQRRLRARSLRYLPMRNSRPFLVIVSCCQAVTFFAQGQGISAVHLWRASGE